MKIIYGKSAWEVGHLSRLEFLQEISKAGFGAAEAGVPKNQEAREELSAGLIQYGLQLIACIFTGGATPEEHLKSLEEQYLNAIHLDPLVINSHTGRDIFSHEDNHRIFQRGCELQAEYGIKLAHETHRGRATFQLPATAQHLSQLPEMYLNADFSHWFCVHESFLDDQAEAFELAISRSHHIHARVSDTEGPQIPDPFAPQWTQDTERFVRIWQCIIDHRKADCSHYLTITPEFGPPPYATIHPATGRPLADPWQVNFKLLGYLSSELK